MGTFESFLKLLTENPITAGAIGTALVAAAAFFKPIMRAVRKALIRRIDQAWPDEGSDEDKVQRTVESMKKNTIMPLPRGLLTTTVRNHKAIPPPDKG